MSENTPCQICADCLMASANGLSEQEEWPAGFPEAYRAAVAQNRGEPVHLSDEEGCLDETAFSRAPCGFCRSSLAGSRYGAVLMR